jgi:uncharacterized protein
MDRRTLHDCNVDVCGGCGCMWFDPRELATATACETTASSIDDPPPQRRGISKHVLATSKLVCPRDKHALVVREHFDQPHVDIDQCPECSGVLLEPGELRDLATLTWYERVQRWWRK